jgi:hypothetical protein
VVVVSCTAGAVLFLTVVVEVVVVAAGTGFSTTVVHDVNSMATTKSGIRMISFFIVGVVFLHWQFGADASTRCLSAKLFPNLFSLIVGPGTHLFRSRPAPFRFQNPLFQPARAGSSLPPNLFPALFFRFGFLVRPSFE